MRVDHADTAVTENVVAGKEQVSHPQRELAGRVARRAPDFERLVADLELRRPR